MARRIIKKKSAKKSAKKTVKKIVKTAAKTLAKKSAKKAVQVKKTLRAAAAKRSAKPAKASAAQKSKKTAKPSKAAKAKKPLKTAKNSKTKTRGAKPPAKPSFAAKLLHAVGLDKPKPAANKSEAPQADHVETHGEAADETAEEQPTEGPSIGADVPDFKMPATGLGEVSAEKLKGQPYILYFYPKDDTSGCTAQACGFRDAVPELEKLGLKVIGVSKDSLESHEKFSEKHGLTFPLASDEATKVAESFGAWVKKSMYGRDYMGIDRSTFLVDAKGTIRAIWRKVNVAGHVEDVKKAIQSL